MKKHTNAFYSILLALVLLTTTFGCKKDDKIEPFMSAKIDGVAWKSTKAFGELEIETGFDFKNMSIKSGFVDDKFIELEINEDNASGKGITVGTYPTSLFSTTINFAQVLSSGATVNYPPASGSITVTKCDENAKTISGTFNAKVVNGTTEINITEGVFTDVSYTIK